MCWVTAAMKSVGESAAKCRPASCSCVSGRGHCRHRLEVHLRRRERVAEDKAGNLLEVFALLMADAAGAVQAEARMLPGEQHLGAVAGQKLLVYQESDHPAAEHLVDMVREGSAEGDLPSRSDFRRELEVSPRTLARDLDFLRDEERAPIEYDARAHGYRLTDETYRLPPVRLSRKEAFSFALVQKLLAVFEGTPLDMDMRSVLAKIRRVAGGRNQRGARMARRTRQRAGRGPGTGGPRL
jgi:hypothetical protein